jgi:hypothetical protein
MQDIINKYLKSDLGAIEIPNDDHEKRKLARALLGSSIVHELDYWLGIAQDYVENKEPKEPFLRDNELSRKDKAFREAFSKLDNETKAIVIKLVSSTATGIIFSLLTMFDQFDFGELTLSLKPKSTDSTEIQISSDSEELHDELSEWIYSFSKFKDGLVEKEENKDWTTYRIK